MKSFSLILIAAVCTLLPATSFANCGAATCTVNTNWTSDSAMVEPGSSLDLRYEFINQDQLRSGSRKVTASQITQEHEELGTNNHNLVASFSHNFDSAWGLSVSAPLIDRSHSHIHDPAGTAELEQWRFNELGDMRVLGRYQLPYSGNPLEPSTMGLTFGVKLPTGSTHVTNSNGEVAERGLQPGSGTTDAILGAFYHRKLPHQNASWFTQLNYQQAINSHDGFKPGSTLSADIGYRHGITEKLSALVQANYLVKQRDSGDQAEPTESGGKFFFVSPGLSYALSNAFLLHGFVQIPLHQFVNGVQLTASRALVVGVSSRF